MKREGDRFIVYLARHSHESYPVAGRFTRIFGIADDITDDAGPTWTPDAVYVNRPRGVDEHGVDTDALRAQINPGKPSDVVLIPTDNPGPLWQYACYRYIQNGGDGIDNQLISQGAPIFGRKWWPDEGPAGKSGVLATKAAEPSGPGVPDSFFDNVATYLGPNPPPGPHGELLHEPAAPRAWAEYYEIAQPSVTAPAATPQDLISDAGVPMLDWRGPVGRYMLDGLFRSAVPYMIDALSDPMVIKSPWQQSIIGLTTIALSDLNIHGIKSIHVASLTAREPQLLRLEASCPMISGDGALTASDIKVATARVKAVGIRISADVRMVTPLAIVEKTPSQWYIPFVGPKPYSSVMNANQVFDHTRQISHAAIENIEITFEDLDVSIGGAVAWLAPVLPMIISLLGNFLRNELGSLLADAGKGVVNGMVDDIYAGRKRLD